MFRDGAVLPGSSFQAAMESNSGMVVKDFNGGIRYPHINFLFDIFIWNRV
jgi:hypothetical protein